MGDQAQSVKGQYRQQFGLLIAPRLESPLATIDTTTFGRASRRHIPFALKYNFWQLTEPGFVSHWNIEGKTCN